MATAAKHQAATKARLVEAGGKRASFNLPYTTVAALDWIKRRDGHATTTEAIIAAIQAHAKGPRRRSQ